MRKVPKVPEFAPFWGESLWAFGTFLMPNLQAFLPCFRPEGGLRREAFLCVFAASNGTYLRQLLECVCPSIPTSTGRPGGFWEMRNAPKVPKVSKVPELALFLARSLGALRNFPKAVFTSVFIKFPLKGGPSPEVISLRLRMKTVLIYGKP